MREGEVNDGINDAQEKQQIALKHKITRGILVQHVMREWDRTIGTA